MIDCTEPAVAWFCLKASLAPKSMLAKLPMAGMRVSTEPAVAGLPWMMVCPSSVSSNALGVQAAAPASPAASRS